jgi:hypothetical protein
MGMEHWWNDTDRDNISAQRKTCPIATLFSTNPTWTGVGSNAGLRGEEPGTDRVSHNTAEAGSSHTHIHTYSYSIPTSQ